MSSEVILNGLIAGGSAILGAIVGGTIAYFVTNKHIKAENKRFLIQEMQRIKVNDTNRLYGIVVDCVDSINFYGNIRLRDYDEFKKKVQLNIDKYESLKQKCEIWYDEKTIKLFNEIMATLRELTHKLFLSTTQSEGYDHSNVFETDEWKKLIRLKGDMRSIIHDFPEFKIYFKFINQEK